MGKRSVIAFSLFCCIVFSLLLRLFTLADGGVLDVASTGSSRSLTAAVSRGMIYDRNLSPLVCCDTSHLICVLPSAESLAVLRSALSEEEYNTYGEQLKKGSLLTFNSDTPELYANCGDIAVLETHSRYSSPQLASHIIGYTSADSGSGEYGVEKCFDGYLSQYSGALTLRYSTDAVGRVLPGAPAEVNNSGYNSGAGVVLTLESTIQSITETALNSSGIETGAVVVLDANTGQLLACASVPTFDPSNIADSLNNEKAPFLNRAFTNYSVGSVFKLIVAAAALECGVDESFAYTCTGSCKKGATSFSCHKRSGHGELDMKTAFTVSCNTYFIELASYIGSDIILSYAESFGFTREFALFDGLSTDCAVLPERDSIDSPAALANLAFGQGELSATPLHLAACYLAAINGGTYYEPSLFLGKTDEDGILYEQEPQALPKKLISEQTSKKLKDYLLLTVETGSGKTAKSEHYLCGGKTATAQTGRFIDGRELLNAWFVGFYPYINPEYVIAVIKEDGSSGSADAAPVFKNICEAIFIKENPTG